MSDSLSLWDWRRRVTDLYGGIRDDADPQAAWRRWCATRAELFRNHPQSPIEAASRPGYDGPPVYPYDPALRLIVGMVPAAAEQLELPVGADGVVKLTAMARTAGLQSRLGGELTLYWIAGYGGGTFLPFSDATSGAETYGAGRYLLDSIKGADLGMQGDRIVLDFNFSYFPSCAYSDLYTCPLAPAANRLPQPIAAGERNAS